MNKKAFTLLELLIALSLSGFIFIVLSQSLKHSMQFLSQGKIISTKNRTIGLLFNQLDKDLSALIVTPQVYKKTKTAMGEKISQVSVREPFELKFYDETIGKDKKNLFRSINFITTNPLKVYGPSSPRLVRVKFELKDDKGSDPRTYTLWRYETKILDNVKFSEEFDSNKDVILEHKVAENLRGMVVDYLTIEAENNKQVFKKHKELKINEALGINVLVTLEGQGKKDDEREIFIPILMANGNEKK